MENFIEKYKKNVVYFNHMAVLALSVALIIFISVDTFRHISLLDNHLYMIFQFWVCVAFLAIFFIDMYFAPRPWHYFFKNLAFFLICIPYLNIIALFNIDVDADQLYFLRFIPLIRGAMALTIIISYVSKNRLTSIFFAYTSIMVLVIYFSSLLFFEREHAVNADVTNYWTSLWWCCMETTTIGAPINPVTVVGKVLAGILATMGMLMFPLFTVYISDEVKKYMK